MNWLTGEVSTLILISCLFSDVLASRCTTCEGIVKKFSDGLKKTAKSGFGGGNTHWEENSLGSFAYSETRLVEILESVCVDSDKECHIMVEEHEENIENWWFKHFAKDKDTLLRTYLCVERVRKACCEHDKWGPTCSPCPTCLGKSTCNGNGTREGTGKCNCSSGYSGEFCGECSDGYYQAKAEEITCEKCHEACESGCDGSGPSNCDSCKPGWRLKDDDQGCEDLNECEAEADVCGAGKYCVNNDGSFKCLTCDDACATCTGEDEFHCIECAPKYFRHETACHHCHRACANSCEDDSALTCDECDAGWEEDEVEGCVDIDECKRPENPCKDGTYCGNFPGDYKCLRCDRSCKKCFGAGPGHCLECAEGYSTDFAGVCKKDVQQQDLDSNAEGNLEDLNRRLKQATKGSTDFPDLTLDDIAQKKDEEIVFQGSVDDNKKEL